MMMMMIMMMMMMMMMMKKSFLNHSFYNAGSQSLRTGAFFGCRNLEPGSPKPGYAGRCKAWDLSVQPMDLLVDFNEGLDGCTFMSWMVPPSSGVIYIHYPP